MGIFSRRRAVAVIEPPILDVTWQAESAEIIVTPAWQMEDECAGEEAYGARFLAVGGPDSSLTIWAFPAECGQTAPDHFFVAYKTSYEWRNHLDTEGVDSGYEGDVTGAEWYDDLGAAADAARAAAAALITAGRGAASQHVPPDVIESWFDWDGVPW